jgi:hypothetical protein
VLWLVEMHTSFSHHRIGRTSGFPCTTNVTAYAGSARVSSTPPVATRLSCDSPSGWTALPSRGLTPPAPASRGFAVRLLPRPSCSPECDRFIRDWSSRPAIIQACPRQSASVVIRHAQATMAIRPSSDRTDSDIYTSCILRQVKIWMNPISAIAERSESQEARASSKASLTTKRSRGTSRTSAIRKCAGRGATSRRGVACVAAAVPSQAPNQDQVPSPGPTAPA